MDNNNKIEKRFFSCRFDKSLYEKIQDLAKDNHRSVTSQIIQGLEDYLKYYVEIQRLKIEGC